MCAKMQFDLNLKLKRLCCCHGCVPFCSTSGKRVSWSYCFRMTLIPPAKQDAKREAQLGFHWKGRPTGSPTWTKAVSIFTSASRGRSICISVLKEALSASTIIRNQRLFLRDPEPGFLRSGIPVPHFKKKILTSCKIKSVCCQLQI